MNPWTDVAWLMACALLTAGGVLVGVFFLGYRASVAGVLAEAMEAVR